MKLLSFSTTGVAGRTRHLGALIDGDVDNGELIDLSAATRALLAADGLTATDAARLGDTLVPPDLIGLIRGGRRARDAADEALAQAVRVGWESDPVGARIRYRTADIEVLPAVVAPPLLRDFMGFEQHLRNIYPRLGRDIPDEWFRRPVYYKANPGSIGGHRQDIVIPGYAEKLDFEFEFAAIIGRSGIDIAEADAPQHIFGFTIYNDFSAREIQALEMSVGLGPAKGKDFVGAHVLGPVVVTADELIDPYALTLDGRVNGARWTAGGTAAMHWRFEAMIAYASRDERLQVGEVFGSGTVGNGSGAEQGRWLDPGDLVELTVSGIGTLANRVVAHPATQPGGGGIDTSRP